jgi:hypothetical protein
MSRDLSASEGSGRLLSVGIAYGIRRVEGNIAKSPSWLVKSVHVRFDFLHVGQMWVQSSLEAVADIRWLGAQELTSHVLDYEAASVVAAVISCRSGCGSG